MTPLAYWHAGFNGAANWPHRWQLDERRVYAKGPRPEQEGGKTPNLPPTKPHIYRTSALFCGVSLDVNGASSGGD